MATRGNRKSARTTATKRTSSSRARSKSSKRPIARRPARPKRAARTKPAARSAKPKPKPARRSAKAAPKRATPKPAARAATRGAAVRDLERGCDALLAAIRGLKAEAAERPIAPGKWSPKQILLHVAYWDEWMLGVLPPAILKDRRPEPLTEAHVNASNASAVAAGAPLSWDDVRSLWATQRSLLLGLLAAVPAAPASRWATDHALGAVLEGYAEHDRHHAAQIRAARSGGSAGRPEFAPAFAAQKANASAKDLLLFELQRARVAVKGAVQGLGAAAAMRPGATGRWSIHEIVLHLAVRDRVRIEEFDALLAGTPPSWDPSDYHGMDAVNEAHLAPLRVLSWDETLRLLETTRAELVARLLAAPSEPVERWTESHPFGATMLELRRHDRHHAEQIRQARITS